MDKNEIALIKKYLLIVSFLILLSIFFILSLTMTGCTLSFSNISTHGTAEDLVDETQTNTPHVSPTITIPVKPL